MRYINPRFTYLLTYTHSFIPGLKPSFSENPSHCSPSFSSSGFTTWIPETVYCYFWAYLFSTFGFSVFTLFSCRFHGFRAHVKIASRIVSMNWTQIMREYCFHLHWIICFFSFLFLLFLKSHLLCSPSCFKISRGTSFQFIICVLRVCLYIENNNATFHCN